jgi:hypothetical protein
MSDGPTLPENHHISYISCSKSSLWLPHATVTGGFPNDENIGRMSQAGSFSRHAVYKHLYSPPLLSTGTLTPAILFLEYTKIMVALVHVAVQIEDRKRIKLVSCSSALFFPRNDIERLRAAAMHSERKKTKGTLMCACHVKEALNAY